MIVSKKNKIETSFSEKENLEKSLLEIYLKNELPNISNEYEFFEANSLPQNHVKIIDRLENILDLIQNKVAAKEDIKASTKEIIESQKKEIADAKALIKELITELEQRSTANIFMLISGIGLVITLCFLVVSIFSNEIKLSYFHFAISSVAFGLVLLMSFISKKNYK